MHQLITICSATISPPQPPSAARPLLSFIGHWQRFKLDAVNLNLNKSFFLKFNFSYVSTALTSAGIIRGLYGETVTCNLQSIQLNILFVYIKIVN